MKKKLYFKKGVEKNIEMVVLGGVIVCLFSLLFTIAFDELFRAYSIIFCISNLIILFNVYLLSKFSRKYQIIFNK